MESPYSDNLEDVLPDGLTVFKPNFDEKIRGRDVWAEVEVYLRRHPRIASYADVPA